MQLRLRTRSWIACAIAAVVAAASLAGAPRAEGAVTRDALERKVRSQLRSFAGWLTDQGARGYVGEIGWPDDFRGEATEWNRLARGWFEVAADHDLWVSSWATGEWWDDYRLAIYESDRDAQTVDQRNSQAEVLEAAAAAGGMKIGINANGGEFGAPVSAKTSSFSNKNPGAYNTRYHYDRQGTFDFLARRGVGHVRIPFRWERIQPRPGGPLNDEEVRRLRGAVGRAWKAGLRSILDVHNYGAYYLHVNGRGVRTPIGSPRLKISDFADLWKRLSRAFKSDQRVAMYALMAEPFGMPRVDGLTPAKVWERASQRALNAIRRNGDDRLVAVPGYGWDALQVFMKKHKNAWIKDRANSSVYEVHHYWDRNYSGDYSRSYADEVEAAERSGW